MYKQHLTFKKLRSMGIILCCGTFLAACAGNAVKPTAQSNDQTVSENTAASTTSSKTTPTVSDSSQQTENNADTTQASSSDMTKQSNAQKADAPASVTDTKTQVQQPPSPQQPTQMAFYFGLNKSTLSSKAKNSLLQHALFLKANPDLVLEINGHTDGTGSHRYNQYLSKLRADAVAKVLISDGVSQSQLVINALGDSKPLADNKDPNKNRRVDLQYDDMGTVSVN